MFKKNVLLKPYSSYRVGGPAAYFTEIKNEDEIKQVLTEARKNNINSIFILGGGTNLLINDRGFNGLVIKISIDFIRKEENSVEVGAGTLLADLVNFCGFNSLSGFEWAGGLPGTVGGAIRGNSGAFKGEIKDNLIQVKSFDLEKKKIVIRLKNKCNFGYRQSIFKKLGPREIILSAKFNLMPGDKKEIHKQIEEKIEYRKEKHPIEYPSAGSIFKNVPFLSIPENIREEFSKNIKTDPVPVVAAGRILNLANLKGEKIGDAMISEKHPNYIVNLGNALSEDVEKLIKFAKNKVKKKFGIELEEEITYVGKSF
ncbi:UDP-N-acetylmuramate dehydrogenase [Patescibacteria group bacterium]|nr:UDP-N-acetylmuramate dehydrogenase [Patescibacteria group bacterium]